MTRNLLVCAALAWAGLGYNVTAGMAQDPILAQFYGSGVHQFFSGGYQQAITDLTEAVDGGTKDPRVYYFRALSWRRLGDTSKAQTDLTAGAKLESADVNQYYPVSKSLERVQGADRLLLERYRVQARAEAYRREEKRNLARYEAQRKAEAEVLRAAPMPPAPSSVAPPTTAVAKPANTPPADEPAAAAPTEEADPFADDPDTAAAPDAMTEKDAEADKDAAPAEEDAADSADEMPKEESEEEPAAGEMKDDADGKEMAK